MATPLFSFTTLNGSDPAGHDSINVLVKSIEDQLNAISSGLTAGAAGTATTGQVLRWSGSTYVNALVNAASLDTGAVTEVKIASGAVTESKIGSGAVTSGKIMSGVALAGQPTVGTATGTYPVAGNDLRIATVKYVKDAADSVTAGTSFAVGGDLSGTTGNATIVTGAVTSDKILNNTIVLEDLATALQAFLTPTGALMPFAGLAASAPTGWLICDGRSYAASGASAALQALLNAAGFTTLPNLSGKTIMAPSGSYALSTSGGGSTTLTSTQLPPHTHTGTTNNPLEGSPSQASLSVVGGVQGGFPFITAYTNTGPPNYNDAGKSHVHSFTTGNGPGSSASVPTIPPYLVLNYIIKN